MVKVKSRLPFVGYWALNCCPGSSFLHEQKLYRPTTGHNDAYPNLQPVVLTRAIDWELIRQQYDQMVKYATALRLGTAEADTILRRFNRSFPQHPTHRALAELGKVVKTIFLCQYLHSEALRREINEGLNVVEHWNGANGFIFYGKNSEIATNRLDEQEVSVLSLHKRANLPGVHQHADDSSMFCLRSNGLSGCRQKT